MDINNTPEESPKNKNAVLVWLALAVIFALVFLVWDSFQPGGQSGQSKQIVFVINYGGAEQKFAGAFDDDVRVWDLLQQATAVSSIELQARSNFVPQKIDGHENGVNGQWRYYINGIRQDVPPFERMVRSGDVVEFRYEKS